jgi:predicted nucleic acid-binding protein
MLRLASQSGVVVPAIWWTELMNALIMAGRRGRVSSTDEARFEGILADVDIQTEPVNPYRVVGEVSRLSRRHGLTAYDATYLELALRVNRFLATLDKRLRAEANNAGAELLSL